MVVVTDKLAMRINTTQEHHCGLIPTGSLERALYILAYFLGPCVP